MSDEFRAKVRDYLKKDAPAYQSLIKLVKAGGSDIASEALVFAVHGSFIQHWKKHSKNYFHAQGVELIKNGESAVLVAALLEAVSAVYAMPTIWAESKSKTKAAAVENLDDMARLAINWWNHVALWILDIEQLRIPAGVDRGELGRACAALAIDAADEFALKRLAVFEEILRCQTEPVLQGRSLSEDDCWPWPENKQRLAMVAETLAPLVNKSERTIKSWSSNYGWRVGAERPNNRDVSVNKDLVFKTLRELGFLI